MEEDSCVQEHQTGSQIDPSYRPKTLKTYGLRPDAINKEQTASVVLVLYTGGTIGMKKDDDGVYVPVPDYLYNELKNSALFNDPTYVQPASTNEYEDPLVLPLTNENQRIIYHFYEYDPLLDSSNMTFDDYVTIAKDIYKNYQLYDGFVVLHGTDTMAYTASALSFMLEYLGKPVVVTGSQIPIFELRTDGRDNFLSALVMAGCYAIPEVTIMFDHKLLRGNRSTKIDASDLDGFGTPNFTPLAKLEISIEVNWDLIFHHEGVHEFNVHTDMCPDVGVLPFFPSITNSTVRAFLRRPMRGVVLETYGAGNGPSARTELLEILRAATDRGVIIVNVTQCLRGSVTPVYEVGAELEKAGVIVGYDMTMEAALMKLSYIISKDWDMEVKRKMIKVSLRGEMTVVPAPGESSLLEYALIGKMAQTMGLSSPEEIRVLRESVLPSLLCSAARDGNNDALEKLRSVGATFNMTDYYGRTPLHVACCEGRYDTVKYLLERGAPVHVRDRFGHTPIDDAASSNHHDIIAVLKAAGSHLRLPQAKLGMLMCNSAAHEPMKNMKSWIAAGANVNQGDYDGRTSLHLAVAHGNEDLVAYLLEAGAKVDEKDRSGKTPLDEARNRGHSKISELITRRQ